MLHSTIKGADFGEEETAFYAEAFMRNIGLLKEEEQEKLHNAHIAIAGLGGVGGIHALSFARLGVGRFSISDKDTFETANINRQAGATQDTFGQDKAEVLEKMIHAINPFAEVRRFSHGISEETVDAFLADASLVIDGLDFFEIGVRRLLFRKAQEKNLSAITAGPVGFGGAMLVFDPQGMSFDAYFDLHDGMSEEEMVLLFGIGLAPALLQRKYFKPDTIDLKKRSAPSLVTGTLFASGLVTCEAVKILLGEKVYPAPHFSQFDPYVRRYKKGYLWGGNRHPLQRFKKWYILRKLKQQQKIS